MLRPLEIFQIFPLSHERYFTFKIIFGYYSEICFSSQITHYVGTNPYQILNVYLLPERSIFFKFLKYLFKIKKGILLDINFI